MILQMMCFGDIGIAEDPFFGVAFSKRMFDAYFTMAGIAPTSRIIFHFSFLVIEQVNLHFVSFVECKIQVNIFTYS